MTTGRMVDFPCGVCGKKSKVAVAHILSAEPLKCQQCGTPYDIDEIAKIRALFARMQKATADMKEGVAKTARGMKAR